MTLRFAPALVAACVLASPLAAQDLQGREGTRFPWSERVAAGQWLRVYGNNGRIQVTEATGDAAEVVGEKELRRGKPEDIAFEVRKTSDGVTICAIIADEDCDDDGVRHHGRWNDDYNGRRVNFTVRVPKGVKVGVGSGNGDVSVSGATADVRAGSGNGKVRVSAGGPVNASSGNGDVTVERAGGPDRLDHVSARERLGHHGGFDLAGLDLVVVEPATRQREHDHEKNELLHDDWVQVPYEAWIRRFMALL